MMEYLEKYNSLPIELRQKLAEAGIISAIHNLEMKYKVSLALPVIKAAIGEFDLINLRAGLMRDLKLSDTEANQLAEDLIQSVFFVLPSFKVQTMQKAISAIPSVSVSKPIAKEPSEIDLKVIDVIKKAKIDLASQALMDRLKQVLRTYLLGVRDNLAVRDALTKPFEIGGLAFSQAVCDEIMKIADGKGETPTQTTQITRPSLPVNLGLARDIDYDLIGALKAKGTAQTSVDPLANQSRLSQQNVPVENKKVVVPNNLPWEGASVTETKMVTEEKPAIKPVEIVQPKLEKASPIIKMPVPEIKKEMPVPKSDPVPLKTIFTPVVEPIVIPAPTVTPTPGAPRVADAGSSGVPKEKYSKTDFGEIKMDDIQYDAPRVFTPIDELKYMSLKNFRNLNPDPMIATQIIKQKIEALGKDDYSWKLEGIMVWKQSPINKMYVDIYQTAMNEGKQIAQIIGAKQKANPEALSEAEFEAIFGFNREISVYK